MTDTASNPMLLSALVEDLKSSLGSTVAGKFTGPGEADLKRLLGAALADMEWKRPITQLGTVQLHALQTRYAVPATDFAALKTHLWASPARTPMPWNDGYPGAAPRVSAQWNGAAWWLEFSPAPTPRQIAVWGAEFQFWYFARHVLSDEPGQTTVAEADRGLLILRAQAEAMRELAMRNVATTTQMRDGYTGTPRNGTPAALFQVLLEEFKGAR